MDAAALIAEADRALDGRIDYGEFLKSSGGGASGAAWEAVFS